MFWIIIYSYIFVLKKKEKEISGFITNFTLNTFSLCLWSLFKKATIKSEYFATIFMWPDHSYCVDRIFLYFRLLPLIIFFIYRNIRRKQKNEKQVKNRKIYWFLLSLFCCIVDLYFVSWKRIKNSRDITIFLFSALAAHLLMSLLLLSIGLASEILFFRFRIHL